MDQTGETKRKRASYTRRPRGPRVWERIRADVIGGMSYRRAGLKWDTEWRTIASRARREGWARNVLEAERDRTLLLEDTARALSAAPTEEALLAQARRALADAMDRGEAKDVRELALAVRALTPARRREAEPDGPAVEEEPVGPDWLKQAHDAQKPPGLAADGSAWRTWVFMGGRGAGKTRAGAEWLDALAQDSPGARFALVAPTLHDVREVMVEGESGLVNLPRAGRPRWEASRRRLRWANGAVAQGFSAEDPESLRGPQFHAAWADEFCAWRDPGAVLPLLRMGLRLGGAPRLVLTTTPKPIAPLRRLLAEAGCAVTRAPTSENAGALAPAFLDGLQALYGGTRLAAQELEGVLVEGEGALWRAEELARCRGAAPADGFERVVVAVDPPATAGGDACGIVVAGRRGERAYVLEDATGAGLSPLGWARRAAECARRWGAAAIVAEANQGGDMVASTLRSAGAETPVKPVWAGRSKRARAEPVAALYEQGRVVHCGGFPQLEEELMALGAADGPGRDSPDRADALVWALTELMLGPAALEPRIRLL